MTRVRFLGLALLLTIGLLAPNAFAQTPDGTTPGTAIELSSAAPVSGTLVGSRAGAFAYYWINYPGGSEDATITMYFSPTDSTMTRSIGLHVWEGNRELTSMTGTSATKGTNQVTFFSPRSGPLIVQVFNYDAGREGFYQLVLTGIPAPEGAATQVAPPAPAPTPIPSPLSPTPTAGDGRSPETAIPLEDSVTGSVVGNSGGAYAYYLLQNHAGDMATLRLEFSPADASMTRAVSVEAWQGHDELTSISAGSSPDRGVVETFFTSEHAGSILVKVGNYLNGRKVDFRLTVTWR